MRTLFVGVVAPQRRLRTLPGRRVGRHGRGAARGARRRPFSRRQSLRVAARPARERAARVEEAEAREGPRRRRRRDLAGGLGP